MAEIEIALVAKTCAAARRITLAQADAGLPSGRYAITAAEAVKLDGLGYTGSCWVDSYADAQNSAWQTQIVTQWGISQGVPFTGRRIRHFTSIGWSVWAEL